MRVLIVDDNASMRYLLTSLLSSQGYTVVGTLEEGNGVMDAVRKLSPEIVCLDYQLPGRNGLDILREINSSHPDIDVLFITASVAPDIEAKAAPGCAKSPAPASRSRRQSPRQTGKRGHRRRQQFDPSAAQGTAHRAGAQRRWPSGQW